MRKTKLGLFVVVFVAMLALLLSGCGGTGSAVDTARVEKTVLSAINKAVGEEWSNDESLRGNANAIWEKVDGQGKIQWIHIMYGDTNPDGTFWMAAPIVNGEELDGNSKLQLIEFNEETLKKYENPSEELLAKIRRTVDAETAGYKLSSVCVTARNIGGRVYVVYVTKKAAD